MEAQVSAPLPRRVQRWAAALLTFWFCGWCGWLLVLSMRWPMVGDAPVLVYMGWLANHGMRLYRDIVEIQFPGSVMIYSAARIVFGPTNFGFRLFDLSVLCIALFSMLAITRREGKWFAGVFGFAYFLWAHAGALYGIESLGQRDFLIAVMLLSGAVALLKAARTGQMTWIAVFGFAVGLAMTMKPPAGVFLLLPLPCFREAGFRARHWRSALAWLISGIAVAFTLVLVYLLRHHALLDFIATERRMLPLYVGISQPTYARMLANLNQPARLLPVLALMSTAVLLRERAIRRALEQQVLLLGTLIGALSYFTQHKGFFYHREPFNVFFFLWVAWVLVSAVKSARHSLALASGVLLLGASLVYPHFIRIAHADDYEDRMGAKLRSMGALDRDGQVQCIDTTDGCTTVMLRAQKAMATGTFDEYLLFLKRDTPARTTAQFSAERAAFLHQLQATRPEYFLITNLQWPGIHHRGYEKLVDWPEFDQLLQTHYALRYELLPTPEESRGYRIYARVN